MAGVQHDLDDLYEDVATGTAYTVEVIARGQDMAMPRGWRAEVGGAAGGIDRGSVGVRLWNAITHFDNFGIAPMILLTTSIETFSEQPHAVKAIQHATGCRRLAFGQLGGLGCAQTATCELASVELSGTQPITYYQMFDIENRLVEVTVTDGIGQTVSRFEYDGDGTRARQVGGVPKGLSDGLP